MRLHRTRRTRTGLSPAVGLLLLSVLWAIDSLRGDLFPSLSAEGVSPFPRQAALFSVFAVVAGTIASARGAEFPRGRDAWASAGIGVGLFVVPAALAECTQGWVSALNRVAVFSLTPVFAVVLEPYLRDGEPRQGKAALAGALAAAAGMLFVLPFDMPGSFSAGAALFALLAAVVCIAVTNCFAVRLARVLAIRCTLPMAAEAGAASAACFAAAVVFTPGSSWRWDVATSQLLWLLGLECPALFLLFWLMPRLAASRITARFLLAPLFTILAGVAPEPASPPARAWLGMALLASGAGWLVFAPAEEGEVVEERNPLNAYGADDANRSHNENGHPKQ